MKSRTLLNGWIFSGVLFFALTGCSSAENRKPVAHTIEIRGMQFLPGELLAQKGDTVIWVNHDIVTHDITEQASKAWSSSSLPTGKSWSKVIENSLDYYCSIHPVMKGRVVVR